MSPAGCGWIDAQGWERNRARYVARHAALPIRTRPAVRATATRAMIDDALKGRNARGTMTCSFAAALGGREAPQEFRYGA